MQQMKQWSMNNTTELKTETETDQIIMSLDNIEFNLLQNSLSQKFDGEQAEINKIFYQILFHETLYIIYGIPANSRVKYQLKISLPSRRLRGMNKVI